MSRFRFEESPRAFRVLPAEYRDRFGALRGLSMGLFYVAGYLALVVSTALAWRYVNQFADWIERVTR